MMYTYVIESQGLYKIGKTMNIDKRMSQFRTHNPIFKLLKVFEGDYEDQLHAKYVLYHYSLEWFKLLPIDIEKIVGMYYAEELLVEQTDVIIDWDSLLEDACNQMTILYKEQINSQ